MTAAQFLARLKKGAPPAVLLLGPEAYERRRIKEALMAVFPEGAVTQHDLSEMALAEALDDARSLSLFAAERLVWVVNAEAALPRPRSEDEEGEAAAGDPSPLAAYMKDPTPGLALVFEAARFDFEGDDKRKQERVRKFYGAVPEVVELRRYSSQDARSEAEALARRAGLHLDPAALDLLVEALGADIARIDVEIGKLALYAGNRLLTAEDIAALAPEARATTIFALVNALGRPAVPPPRAGFAQPHAARRRGAGPPPLRPWVPAGGPGARPAAGGFPPPRRRGGGPPPGAQPRRPRAFT